MSISDLSRFSFNALVPSMPDEDNNFGDSLVLDLRIS